MALKGSAFLALWNDFDPTRDAEYNCWHSFEHVPERVGIDGILSGRRYAARARREDRYFTLYELDSLAALAGPQYLDVIERPTVWTLSMRPSFRNFQRFPCTTLLSKGVGISGALATLRFGVGRDTVDRVMPLAASVLRPFLHRARVTSFHLGAADEHAQFPMQNASDAQLQQTDPNYVLLIEALDAQALDRMLPDLLAELDSALQPSHQLVAKTFQLDLVVDRLRLAHATTDRQPPRPDLRARW